MKPESAFRRRLASFGYAIRGIGFLFRTQVHAWFHLAATLGVIAAGFCFSVSASEWCLIILSIGLVWTAEALNTAIEFTVDLASPEHHDLAGKAKDVAAAAVLLASVTAAIIGVIVFGSRIPIPSGG